MKDWKPVFESNCYYVVEHSCTCIIKAIRKLNAHDDLWEIEIIKLITAHPIVYHESLITNWYESWCFNIHEINDPNDGAEILAIIM